MNKGSIGIVTVLYNSTPHLSAFIDSLILNKEAIGEVVFIDNGSHDNPELVLSKLDLSIPHTTIKNESNAGYAKAVNQGLRDLLKKEYNFILVTNNDLKIQNGGLTLLLDDMISSRADVVGVPTTNDGKNYILGCHYDKQKDEVFSDPVATEKDIQEKMLISPVRDTVYVQGGIILFNKSFLQKIGLYDEYLFFGGDESDFVLRILASKEAIKAVISLRSYDKFDHFTNHDGRFKLLKAKMITQGETYVLMKHGYGLFSKKLHTKIKSLFSELGKGSLLRAVLLVFFFIRALMVNTFYLSSIRTKSLLNKEK